MMVRSAAVARALIDAGANPLAQNEHGETVLSRAVYLAPDVTQLLLNAGVPPDEPNSYGRTPLLQAACAGNAGVVKLLLDRKADPTRDSAGGSALECARQGREFARVHPQADSGPPFLKEFDAVIALLEHALATRARR
jgi:ankyrin repeat protein